MKPNEIKDLIDFIAKSELDEVNIETESFSIAVKRHSASAAPTQVTAAPVVAAPTIQAAPATPAAAAQPEKSAASDAHLIAIKSPIIGTFYRSPNPESPSFVNVGDEVKKGEPVCIVEAMKLFNEIESDISGKIVKVLVEDKSPVEFDQPLFLVDPS